MSEPWPRSDGRGQSDRRENHREGKRRTETDRERSTTKPSERQQSGFGALKCLCQLMPAKPEEIIIAQRAVGESWEC